jgi:hypothetical protein
MLSGMIDLRMPGKDTVWEGLLDGSLVVATHKPG